MRLTLRGKNGSLHQGTQKVTNKHGHIVCYPKVKGNRNPLINSHWKWQFTFKVKVEDRWKSCCISVPHKKVERVKGAISQNLGLEEILAILKP